MYLVSIYFDEKADARIRSYIKQVAKHTGNGYMVEDEVPPHITISAFETRHEEAVIRRLQEVFPTLAQGTVQWASVGTFFPSVIFLAPVVNQYLHGLSETICESISGMEDVSVSKCYRPFQWTPHTTIGKKLSKEEMQQAFAVLQNSFSMFQGKAVRIGLAKTNPYCDLISWEWKE